MKCPKCGVEISRFDLSPNCKKCGVHIMYYTQEDDLMRDAKKTELEFTSARLLVAKLKAAFIGGKTQILRFVFLLLSVGALALPQYNINFTFPWWEYEISVGAIGIYNIINDSLWQIFDALSGIGVAKGLFIMTVCSLVLLAIAALSTVFCLGLWIISFINIKKTAKISIGFGTIGILSHLAGTVISFMAVKLSGAYEFISVKPLFGGILGIAVLSAFLATCIVLIINEPEIKISEADRRRLEIKKLLKNGEITLDELPLPVVEEEKEKITAKSEKRGKKK